MCEAPDEEHGGSGMEKGCGGSDGDLEILGGAPIAAEPGVGEADLAFGLPDNLDGDASGLATRSAA